ncbi:MAG: transaldolase [Candidatus Doudnabacteria bacterium]|nr:transaldolase [Candidatus Doudnabacteria bacterium]
MKPDKLKAKIFLDSGDPAETREILSVLGFLDGQTTNPSLIAKNPETAGKKFSQTELLSFYRKVVEEVSSLILPGSVSIEVYADSSTSAEEMFKQGREFYQWIPNAHVKYPTTHEGLKAAEISVKEGMRVNMTLVFSQEQAAAVYAATLGASRGQVFVSPFVGRLDDIGERGMGLIANIIKMYQNGDGHVEVLTASVRSVSHIKEALSLGCDILTAPVKVLREAKSEILNSKSETNSNIEIRNLKPILYQEIDLNKTWQEYNIQHELTDKGIKKFAKDWNNLIEQD